MADAEAAKPATGVAEIFTHGRSQAVRLPKEFRLPGKEVRVRRVGNGVLPIGPYDILVAAQARRRRATLVTANIRESARARPAGRKLDRSSLGG
jgi:virulence-associated protein VagC